MIKNAVRNKTAYDKEFEHRLARPSFISTLSREFFVGVYGVGSGPLVPGGELPARYALSHLIIPQLFTATERFIT